MPMLSVTLKLSAETAQRLRRKASLSGQSLESYLLRLAEQEAQATGDDVALHTKNGANPSRSRTDVPTSLPLWDGVVVGSLSRRELYEDVD
jgi:hypothetical protein